MKVSKRICKMGPILVTQEQEILIREFLFRRRMSFSSFGLSALLDAMRKTEEEEEMEVQSQRITA